MQGTKEDVTYVHMMKYLETYEQDGVRVVHGNGNINGQIGPKLYSHSFEKLHSRHTTIAYTSTELKKIYGLAPITPVSSRINVAIISLGGGFKTSDLTAYWDYIGLQGIRPKVSVVSVDGATNSPGDQADVENVLDIQTVGGILPNSNILVYMAPNTIQGFYNAVYTAAYSTQNPVKVISISWGAPEKFWPRSSILAFNNLLKDCAAKGITVCVASGDDGSRDGANGINVDFPASSPWTLACGGTSLLCSSGVYKNSTTTEKAWGASHGSSGGGYSTIFTKPSYQNSVSTLSSRTTRGVPDVSGVADPATGVVIVYNGEYIVVGGTSAVAPMWAGFLAGLQLNQFVTPILYNNPSNFNDVTKGTNGDIYSASKGWDPVTGLGSPVGSTLASLLRVKARK